MTFGYYKNYLYTHRYKLSSEKKKKKKRSPSIWFRTPKPVRIRQSGRTGIGGVTGETSQAKEYDPYKPPGEDRNEGIPGRNNRGNRPILYQQEIGERLWEQRFRDIQQELDHMKETIKGRASVSMDALVQQTESLLTAGILHFPLPAKFRMPQIETFDRTKDPIGHLKTYKNQMELHGY